ncbi:calpain-B isoform X1 [Exaiptasia diaphana]|uniref:Uncharacterized protein n=2 Tax=Exaiptasia diaphana TaxID=2652724 RepID=A0A913X030_EXADI|nr:calpain-B isoform X1 [Exaiptasia diaphana]
MRIMTSRDIGRESKYERLRLECLRDGKLYEDPEFPANVSSLYDKNPLQVNIEWKRPSEISRNPKFFSDGASRHDVAQGRLENCWFLSSLSTLAEHKSLLYRVCPPHQTFRKGHYCGLFVFRFWRFGEWNEVIIDDRIPTFNGRPYFTRSTDPNEFWCCLVEKAYCKLYRSYEALNYGLQSEGLQDFTGGVVERIKMSSAPYNLLGLLKTSMERNSLIGTCVVPKGNEQSLHLPNGLICGHSYSITALRKVELRYLPDRPIKHLIRLRNPWGEGAEWRGAWSDNSKEWKMLSERQKYELDLTHEKDGEFWMDFDDFITNLSLIEICMLTPDSATDSHKKVWEQGIITGRWQPWVNAGGCRNFIKTFHRNPQIRVKLSDPDEDDENNYCSMVINLMRKDKKRLRRDAPIGFAVYKVPNGLGKNERLTRQFFENNHAVAKTNMFTKEREITLRCTLPPGDYAIIPSTYEANTKADFILRIFSEKFHETREIDERTELLGPPRPKLPNFDRQRFDKTYKKFFHDNTGEDATADQHDLQHLLNEAFGHDNKYVMFSLETSRSLITMFDNNDNGSVEYEEFVEIFRMIKVWKRHFQYYDRDTSGDMDIFEMRDALKGLNFLLSNRALEGACSRYQNKRGVLSFDMFVQVNVRLILIFEAFLRRSRASGIARFNMDDLMKTTLCI